MQAKEIRLEDGRKVGGAAWRDGVCWLAPETVQDLLGGYARRLDDGRWALCRDELCAPLADGQRNEADGTLALEGLCAALDMEVVEADGDWLLRPRSAPGLGVGMRPPGFSLPELDGSAERSPAHFHGRRAVFYMWASW